MKNINQTAKHEQKEFFQECMKNAGYKSYADLAEHIVLSLPDDIDFNDKDDLIVARRNITNKISVLASGKQSPISQEEKNKGKITQLAIEIAGLLSIEPEALFFACPELTNAQIEMSNIEEEIDGRFDSAPDINLIRRDIDKALETIPEDKRAVLLHLVVFGRTQVEIAKEMSLEVSDVQRAITYIKAIWPNRLDNNLSDYKPVESSSDKIEYLQNICRYSELPEGFNTSHFVNNFLMDAARIGYLCSRKHGIPDTLDIKLRKEIKESATTVDRVLALPTSTGSVLDFCDGSVVTSLLIHFERVGHRPNLQLMQALETIANKPNEYWSGTRADFFDAVSGIAIKINDDQNNNLKKIKESCHRILAIR